MVTRRAGSVCGAKGLLELFDSRDKRSLIRCQLVTNIFSSKHVNRSGGSQIGRFALRAILDAQRNSCLEPEHLSKSSFDGYLETCLVVSKNQNTIIGVNANKNTQLVMEDITQSRTGRSPTLFGQHENRVYSITLIEDRNVLCAGDHNGNVTQYATDFDELTCKHVMNYVKLDNHPIIASASLGHLVITGSNGGYHKLVDTEEQKRLAISVHTGVQYIRSLKAIAVSESQVCLAVSGSVLENPNANTNIFDVTELVEQYGVEIGRDSCETESKASEQEARSVGANCQCNPEHIVSQIMARVDQYLGRMLQTLVRKFEQSAPEPGRLLEIGPARSGPNSQKSLRKNPGRN